MLPQPDVREYLAAERTLLSYVRTGLSMMGLGFVVARFSLFLREVAFLQAQAPAASNAGLSPVFGMALVILGVIVNLVATVEYRRIVQHLNEQNGANRRASRLAMGIAVLLSAIGSAMTAYILTLG